MVALPAAAYAYAVPRWAIFVMLLPGLIALTVVVVVAAFRRPTRGDAAEPAPGYYHVLGIDKGTGAKRESTFPAATEQGARGRAEMEGILVTEVRRVNETTPS